MKAVESSWITHLGYDKTTKKLYLCTKTDAKYVYHAVPLHEFDDFIHANSHGGYFNAYIRNNYNYDLIDKIPTFTKVGTYQVLLSVDELSTGGDNYPDCWFSRHHA